MRAKAFYKALLRCYPAPFREEYGGQMELMFNEQLDDARREGRFREQLALWARAAADAFTIAPREHLHVIAQDIRYALRTMAARPSFTAIAILSLALGIGANTAIFSVWNGLLHAPLPGVAHPEQLVILSNPNSAGSWHGATQGDRDWLTYSEFEHLRARTTAFSSLMASQSYLERWQLSFGGRDWEEGQGRLVSPGYFEFLGVQPALGRMFTAGDGGPDTPYAVISHKYWKRRFGATPDVLGRTVTVRNALLTIIGVAPEGFMGETAQQQPDLWVPLQMQTAVIPGENWLRDASQEKVMWLHVFGRLKPGVTLARASAETNAIFHADLESFYGAISSPEQRRELLDQRLKLQPGARGASETRGDFATSLTALFAAVALLLLIACANIANLLLARGATRKPEMALRLSLGASRNRLIRQLVTESLVLASFGGVCGLAAAWLVHGVVVGMIAVTDRNFDKPFSLDPLALAFTVAVTLAAALLCGLLPAWQVTRHGAGAGLKSHGRGTIGSFGQMRWSRTLVTVQLALSLPLLVGAGLLARTLYNLQHVQLGFSTERLLLVGINSRVAGYDSARSGALYRDLLERIQRIPGVQAASFSHNGVFTGTNSSDDVEVEGYTPRSEKDREARWDMVGPGFFSTLRIPMVLGREILATDHAAAPKVCVINEEFAKQYFSGRTPLGMHITIDRGGARTSYQVVGVARNARTHNLRDNPPVRFFFPIAQAHADNVKRANFLIRTASPNYPSIAAIRQMFLRVDPALPILYARSVEEQMAPSTATDRTTAQVAIVFGCVALTLAAIGLYGMLSYAIARRKGEIAIRIALGAHPARVVGMVLRETGVMVGAGLALGAGLTYTALRWLQDQLFGVPPQDLLTLAGAMALLLLVAFTAVYLPARKASRVDPMTALRQE